MADEDTRAAMLRVLRDLWWAVAFAGSVLVMHVALETQHRFWIAEQNVLIIQAINEVCRNRGNVNQTTNIGVEQRHDEIENVTREILRRDGKL